MGSRVKEESDYYKRYLEFIALSNKFRLGELGTEQAHSKTQQLSQLARDNLPLGLAILKQIDLDMLLVLKRHLPEVAELAAKIEKVLQARGKIFLCGCGATGRLSLTLETLWRRDQQVRQKNWREQVVSFMAGGDVALIHSIESFEDFPSYGARQLLELGFSSQDLLIACTEGGETPFVIGATLQAKKSSAHPPWFLYCNEEKQLSSLVERSREVLQDAGIKKINLDCGPMALAGSTRLQASSILLLAVGLALLVPIGQHQQVWQEFYQGFEQLDINFLRHFILAESEIYRRGEYLCYQSPAEYGITVLTDTTERSPTFSLHPFENQNEESKCPSWCYLSLEKAQTALDAWHQLLARAPRPLAWTDVPGIKAKAGEQRLLGFDFSSQLPGLRASYLPSKQHLFLLREQGPTLTWQLGQHKALIEHFSSHAICRHVLLKILLNDHSTLIMGRLERYQDNFMTWVRASNNKLIDRAIRYAQQLLAKQGIEAGYQELALLLFELKTKLPLDQSLVLAMVQAWSEQKKLQA